MSHSEAGGEMIFRVLRSATPDAVGPRVGRLCVPKRRPVDTPNYFGLTSRGSVPHMTPDIISKHTELGGTYMALEDFVEKSPKRPTPGIYSIDGEDKAVLHAYTATSTNMTTVLGARRHPAVAAPTGNGKDYVSIYTSTGFRKFTTASYFRSVEKLNPDIAIPLADLTFGYAPMRKTLPTVKRQVRMVERTEDWLAEFFELRESESTCPDKGIAIFAPLLPVDYPTQWEYLNRLGQDYAGRLAGLAVYDPNILPDLSNHDSLTPLPRFSLDFIRSPHEIIRQVQLGMDMFTLTFLNNMSDAGVALTFSFPPAANPDEGIQPLGIDMWSQDHQISLNPLVEGCKCYTCNKHHRAYLQHCLNAKEMIGWTLLQIHNHHVISEFFAGIRASISKDPSSFEKECDLFTRIYDSDLPKGTGERPRARGYHFKPPAGQKINPPAWEKYGEEGAEDRALAAEAAGLAVTGTASEGIETPVVPEAGAEELDEKGFAEIDK